MDGSSVPKSRLCSKCGQPRQSHTCYCNACYAAYNQARRLRIRTEFEASLPEAERTPPGMRRCHSCERNLPLSSFPLGRVPRTRKRARCKECMRERLRSAYVPKKRLSPEERFWSNVDVRGDDECWDWIPTRDSVTYGTISVGSGRAMGTHRFAWALANGCDPGALFVCHRCDRPCCVNARHLFLGTTQDNTADRVAKNRCQMGERTTMAKITTEQAAWALEQHALGRPQNQIAIALGVTRHAIWRLVHGRSWQRALGKRRVNGAA